MRVLPLIAALLLTSTFVGSRVDAAGSPASDKATVRLDDIGTQLQFDFYTADLNALQRDLASLAALEVPAGMIALKSTYAGFGDWKRAELLRDKQPGHAAEAARNCSAELERAVALEPRRAGLLAMLSVCERLVAELQGRVAAPLATGRARRSLERASMLAPRDPHVLLIEGIAEYERVLSMGGDFSTARKKLSAATARFEVLSSSAAVDAFTTAMSWGVAESWNYLGQIELAQRDTAAARDAFERALVLAGDYRDVQLRLAEITGRRDP